MHSHGAQQTRIRTRGHQTFPVTSACPQKSPHPHTAHQENMNGALGFMAAPQAGLTETHVEGGAARALVRGPLLPSGRKPDRNAPPATCIPEVDPLGTSGKSPLSHASVPSHVSWK